MKISKNDIGKICHEVNKMYCEIMGDTSQVHWNEAPDYIKESALQGVELHLNNETTPEDSHISWMENKKKDGWVYGEEKNATLKTHPCMVEYNELPAEQRVKDLLFKSICDTFKIINEDYLR